MNKFNKCNKFEMENVFLFKELKKKKNERAKPMQAVQHPWLETFIYQWSYNNEVKL